MVKNYFVKCYIISFFSINKILIFNLKNLNFHFINILDYNIKIN